MVQPTAASDANQAYRKVRVKRDDRASGSSEDMLFQFRASLLAAKPAKILAERHGYVHRDLNVAVLFVRTLRKTACTAMHSIVFWE